MTSIVLNNVMRTALRMTSVTAGVSLSSIIKTVERRVLMPVKHNWDKWSGYGLIQAKYTAARTRLSSARQASHTARDKLQRARDAYELSLRRLQESRDRVVHANIMDNGLVEEARRFEFNAHVDETTAMKAFRDAQTAIVDTGAEYELAMDNFERCLMDKYQAEIAWQRKMSYIGYYVSGSVVVSNLFLLFAKRTDTGRVKALMEQMTQRTVVLESMQQQHAAHVQQQLDAQIKILTQSNVKKEQLLTQHHIEHSTPVDVVKEQTSWKDMVQDGVTRVITFSDQHPGLLCSISVVFGVILFRPWR